MGMLEVVRYAPSLRAGSVGVVPDDAVADAVVPTGEHNCEPAQPHLHELLVAPSSIGHRPIVTHIEDVGLNKSIEYLILKNKLKMNYIFPLIRKSLN